MPKYQSSSNQRQMICYLKPRAYMIIKAEQRQFFMRGTSEHLNSIIDNHINSMSEEKQKKLINEYYEFINKSKQVKQP